jgi:glycosyltransferase involved in cell wall biosynthesis
MKEILIFNILFKWKYTIASFKAWLLFEKPTKEMNTITYVAREVDKEWILGAINKRLTKFSQLKATSYFHSRLKDLPQSDGYFFIFPNYFCRAIRHNPFILNRKNIVLYTHAHWTSSYSKTHIAWCLKRAHRVICMNTTTKKQLVAIGIQENKIEVLHLGSSPETFYSHERNAGAVGFCCAQSQRKNPELIFNIIKNMPEKQFYIIGVKWDKFDKYEELISFPNLTYIDKPDYEDYPAIYSKLDTYISTSFLEGGPVPLLESMLSNCFPIASNTGFCTDIIEHGKNGFLFDPNTNAEEVIALIKKADLIKTNTRETVLEHSWENCSKKIDVLFTND